MDRCRRPCIASQFRAMRSPMMHVYVYVSISVIRARRRVLGRRRMVGCWACWSGGSHLRHAADSASPPGGAMMPDEKVFYVRSNDIVHDTIEGETVVIDLRSGIYFRFEGAATDAWHILLRRCTEAALVDRLAAAYAAPREAIADHVHRFLLALYGDGIIRREDLAAATPAGEAAGPDLDAPGALRDT